MGLFGRRDDPEKALARDIARRGATADAAVRARRDTGASRGRGSREVELELEFRTAEGERVLTTVRQHMADAATVGLEPGGTARVMYVRDDPQRVVVLGSADHVIVDGVAVKAERPAPLDAADGTGDGDGGGD